MYHNIDVDILVNGRPVRKYSHSGRVFIQSKHWTEYSIRIKNNCSIRKLAVVSVDGVNVIDGQPAGSSQAGYIIHAWSSYEVKGFRTSNEEVHPFKFNRKERSYAAKSEVTQGDTSNCGVIGIEIYNEKTQLAPIVIREPVVIKEIYPHYYGCEIKWINDMSLSCSSSPVSCSCASNLVAPIEDNDVDDTALMFGTTRGITKKSFDMGTEFSKQAISDRVSEVAFEIGSLMIQTSIYYASYAALQDMGVPMEKTAQVTFPNPFPAKFCKPPLR